MVNIQTTDTGTVKKYLLFTPILLWVLLNPLSAQERNQKNIYAVVRADASSEMLSRIRQSLVSEGINAEFTNQKYNDKGQLTDIRMAVKQGNRLIGEITNRNQLLEEPWVFYSIKGEKMGLSRGYPKDLPAEDRKKINSLHGFMVTDGSHLEIHGKYKSENLEINGKYKSNE